MCAIARAEDLIPPFAVAPHAVVTEIVDQIVGWRTDDRILGCLGKGAQIVVSIGHTGELMRAVDAGIHNHRFAVVDDGTSRKHTGAVVGHIWRKGDGEVCPMHQIGADRMPPVHSAPECAMGIELIKQMIFALPVDESIGVI